jgi:hypothetical protein
MREPYVVTDLKAALAQRLHPTVILWNRLEGRPRTDNFDRALKAEVRDALWMLAKQWQLGELRAEDAGSPIFAKLRVRASPFDAFQPAGGSALAFSTAAPLETQAEKLTIRWTSNGQKMRLDLRAQLGRQFRKLLGPSLAGYVPQFVARYPFLLPAKDEITDYIYAHRDGWAQLAALAGRAIDGAELFLYLTSDPAHRASDGIAIAISSDATKLDAAGAELVRWFRTLYDQPTGTDAWTPPYLEYQFSCSAAQQGLETILDADEYAAGRIDWYAFDQRAGHEGLGAPKDQPSTERLTTNMFIPTPVTFPGMPEARWWTIDDRKTDLGGVRPSTTDLGKLLLMEFGLVYANDWFLVPLRIPVGAIARIEGLAVTTTFGERFWITAVGTGPEKSWQRWRMFEPSPKRPGEPFVKLGLVVPSTPVAIMDGDVLEDVEIARDEVANMVWAIERMVPSLAGPGRPGKDEARETRAFHEALVEASHPPPIAYQASIAYQAMTGVPENWVPFIPVHVDGSVREIQLQRGRMLRIIDGDPLPPEGVPPRTTVLRDGLDEQPKRSFFLHEEEVPRSGVCVTESFRRARWTHGEVSVWLGIQKQIGRGERSSKLAFDTIVDTPQQ